MSTLMSSRRLRAASLTRGLMASPLDQRLPDLEAGEGELLTNGASTTYVPPVRRGPANSWTPNSAFGFSPT